MPDLALVVDSFGRFKPVNPTLKYPVGFEFLTARVPRSVQNLQLSVGDVCFEVFNAKV